MEKYTVVNVPAVRGRALIRRASDGLMARCKLTWLELVSGETYQARSKTKALRLDGLEWTTGG